MTTRTAVTTKSLSPDEPAGRSSGASVENAGPNQKSMNTSIHALEALTGLYKIGPTRR